MNVNAGWLLKNHRYIISRRLFLETLLQDEAASTSLNRSDVIDVITYMHRMQKEPTQNTLLKSRTEYAAMNVNAICESEEQNRQASIAKWSEELRTIECLQSMHDAIICGLTEEEQALVKMHYDENKSLASLSEAPLCKGSYPRSQSTLKRMLKGIERKANYITSMTI